MKDELTPVVLFVEDDNAEADLADFAFRRSTVPHKVLRARDGVEALDLAIPRRGHADAVRPALVLLDLKLPRLGGREVLRELREDADTRWLPVVILSGSNQAVDVVDCYSLHANSYLRKPIDFGMFNQNIALLLFYWLQLNAPVGDASGRVRRIEGVQEAARRAGLVEPPKATRPAPTRRGPILVLDEDAETRGRTVEGLAPFAAGAQILAASSMEDAERQLLVWTGVPAASPWMCPSLVLLDIDRHPVDGPRMVEQIRARSDHRLPIVFFTANDDPAFVDACYRHLPNSVVYRPASARDHADVIRIVGHYWLGMNERPAT